MPGVTLLGVLLLVAGVLLILSGHVIAGVLLIVVALALGGAGYRGRAV